MNNKPLSTFEREMQDPAFKKQFDEEYKDFQLSEMIHEPIETNKKHQKTNDESGRYATGQNKTAQ
ncbi:MAG: hypothetical protein WC627_00940 [Legionella sp.]|jgi:hypothetical protein